MGHFIRSGGTLFLCLIASYIIIRGVLGTAIDVINWLIRITAPSTKNV